jgi:ArsR family transcriptional regulator, arsenate/arsenite/antimonite-responsive transcriptional repressor
MQEYQAAESLAALGNRTRLRLFRLLVRAGEAGVNVGDIQRHLDVPASTLAHHLAVLARAGLVEQDRHGREVLSRANYPAMDALLSYLSAECCAGILTESSDGTKSAEKNVSAA